MSFSPHWHYLFDGLAYLASAVLFRRELGKTMDVNPALSEGGYWVSLTVGAILFAFLFGSWNLGFSGGFVLGHSVAGAIAGGILGAELFKWRKGFRGSTGALFVIPLSLGISLGRLGCFFSGLSDQTFGIASQLPWAVNFGDGIPRHPVQLYESLALLFFLAAVGFLRRSRARLYSQVGFYLFVLFYASQRFFWEFLKPYATVAGSLNLFHLLCIALGLYSGAMLWSWHASNRSPA